MPGAREALARMAAAGVSAGVVTSGSRVRVEREIRGFGFEGAFATIVCGEDAQKKKPDAEALETALSRLAIAARDAAYVGDSPEDIHMARAAGVYAVGIEGGFPNGPALRESAPDVLAKDLTGAMNALLHGNRNPDEPGLLP